MNELREELTSALSNIYSINIVPFFARLLEGEQAVLLAILQHKITAPNEICKATGIEKNRMSAIVRTLNTKKMIVVTTNSVDKRKLNLSLTAKGKTVIMKKIVQANMIFDKFIELVGENDVKELTRIINLTVEKMGEIKNELR